MKSKLSLCVRLPGAPGRPSHNGEEGLVTGSSSMWVAAHTDEEPGSFLFFTIFLDHRYEVIGVSLEVLSDTRARI